MSFIFSLNFFLSKSTGKFGVLLSSFLKLYTDASEYEIGLVLTSVPIVMTIAKPILCTMMDRMQAHKLFLILSYGCLCFGYVPFVLIPLFGKEFYLNNARACLYILAAFNVIADVGSAVVETLDDTLAVNYAKQVNARFTHYRMLGTISYGALSLLVGQVNDGFWFLPKYSPVYAFLMLATGLMMLLLHLWPSEFFEIAPCDSLNVDTGIPEPRQASGKRLREIQVCCEMRKRFVQSLRSCLCLSSSSSSSSSSSMQLASNNNQKNLSQTSNSCDNDNTNSIENSIVTNNNSSKIQNATNDNSNHNHDKYINQLSTKVSKRAQIRVFKELILKDPRIVAYLSIIAFCGTTLQLQYFLFLYLTRACNITTPNTAATTATTDMQIVNSNATTTTTTAIVAEFSQFDCNYSKLAGFMQAAAAFAECMTFLISEPLVARVGRLTALQLAMLALVARFVYYAFFFTHSTPYLAIGVECLFGFVTAIYSTIKPEIAFMFANEVSLILPKLLYQQTKNNISLLATTSTDALKKCLASSMQGAFSLSYSGLGRTAGALIAGAVIGARNSYEDLWLFSACCCFSMGATLAAVQLLGRCIDIRPNLIKYLNINNNNQQQLQLQVQLANQKLASVQQTPSELLV